jgi:hypothetical protein
MRQSIMNDVVEVMLAERRRDAARQRRIAGARRAGRAQRGSPAWRVRVGGWLVTAGSAIAGHPARGTAVVRGVGGPC